MGFKVGMPTLELKQTKSAAAKNGKRFGDGRSICVEAGEERYSKTRNFDPSRSDMNAHLGRFASGDEAWDYVKERVGEAEEMRRAKGKRGYRKDATVAYALIVKPEGDWANTQTHETLARFFDDAAEVLDELGIVKRDEVVMRERHWDEGLSAEEPCVHEHYVFMAHDAKGDLAGSRHLRLREFSKLNRDFPRIMRERYGWECEELTDYDAEKTKGMTPEEKADYKAEHIAKKKAKRHGLSANEYIAEREAEKQTAKAEQALGMAKAAQELAADATAAKDAAIEQRDIAAAQAAGATAAARRAEKDIETRMQELAAIEPKLAEARAKIASADADKKAAEDARDAARQELAEMEPKLTRARADKAAADKARDDAEAAKKAAEKERDDALAERDAAVREKAAQGEELRRARVLIETRKRELEELDAKRAEKEQELDAKLDKVEGKLTAADFLIGQAQTALDEAEAQRQKDADVLSRLETYVDRTWGGNPKLERVVKLVHQAVTYFRSAEAPTADAASQTRQKAEMAKSNIGIHRDALPRYRSHGDDYGIQ